MSVKKIQDKKNEPHTLNFSHVALVHKNHDWSLRASNNKCLPFTINLEKNTI